MVREIETRTEILSQKSEAATLTDLELAQDLMDTLLANKDACVGMAANMIGVCKRIIVFQDGNSYQLMFNPVIVRKEGPYETTEGCLSLKGKRYTTRYEKIKVSYQNEKFQTRQKVYTGWTAEIIQHEIDHCEGIVI